MTTPIRVAVTGAGGQIGYALIFRIASGAAFGPDQPVALQLLEITPALPRPERDADGAGGLRLPAPGRRDGDRQAEEAFAGADWVILVGGLPRKDGHIRADLIRANGPIFTGQGKAINEAAGPDVRVLTVANPCNTNCLIARSHAPKVPADRWFAMTRLDQNRAASQLARKAGVPVGPVIVHDDLGQPQRHPVSRLQERPDRRQAGDRGHPDAAWFTETYHPDRGQARRRGDQGPRRVVGRLGGQRGHRQRPLAQRSRPPRATGSAPRSSPTAATAFPPA